MNSEFKITLGAIVDGFIDSIDKALDSVKGLGSDFDTIASNMDVASQKAGASIKKIGEGAKDSGVDVNDLGSKIEATGKNIKDSAGNFKLWERSGLLFQELNKRTSGFGREVLTLGTALKDSFSVGVAGAKALRVALISTGIGALVVALGLIVAYWDEIKGAVVGVSAELSDQRKVLEKQAELRQHELDLLNASDNVLKLQGKSQTEINNLKIKQLGLLLTEKEQILENLRVSLKSAQKQEETYFEFARSIRQYFVDIQISVAKFITKTGNFILKGFVGVAKGILTAMEPILELSDKALGTDLTANIDKIKSKLGGLKIPDLSGAIQFISDKIADALNPDRPLSKNLEKDFKAIEIEVAKIKNKIAGLNLSNFKIAVKFNAKELSVGISKIEEDLAKLSLAFLKETDFATKTAILKKQLDKQTELIDLQYKKAIVLAGKDKLAREQATIEKNTALLNLEKKYFNNLSSLIGQENATQVAEIRANNSRILKEKLDALKEDVNINNLTKKERAKFNQEIEALKVESHNKSLLEQNAYWQKLLDGDTLNGQQRINAEKIIQANLSSLRTTGFNSVLTALETFNLKAGEIITNGISKTFENLGASIGEAIGTGANAIALGGSALLGTLGGLLVQLGKMAIQVGIGIKAVKVALKSLNPAIAIAGGIGLIALGSAFSKGASNLANSSGGGGASDSSGGGVSGSTTNSYGAGGGGFSGGRVVFEIAGTKLVGVLSNTLNQNSNLGGDLTLG